MIVNEPDAKASAIALGTSASASTSFARLFSDIGDHFLLGCDSGRPPAFCTRTVQHAYQLLLDPLATEHRYSRRHQYPQYRSRRFQRRFVRQVVWLIRLWKSYRDSRGQLYGLQPSQSARLIPSPTNPAMIVSSVAPPINCCKLDARSLWL